MTSCKFNLRKSQRWIWKTMFSKHISWYCIEYMVAFKPHSGKHEYPFHFFFYLLIILASGQHTSRSSTVSSICVGKSQWSSIHWIVKSFNLKFSLLLPGLQKNKWRQQRHLNGKCIILPIADHYNRMMSIFRNSLFTSTLHCDYKDFFIKSKLI